jgi:hypothetical protein
MDSFIIVSSLFSETILRLNITLYIQTIMLYIYIEDFGSHFPVPLFLRVPLEQRLCLTDRHSFVFLCLRVPLAQRIYLIFGALFIIYNINIYFLNINIEILY